MKRPLLFATCFSFFSASCNSPIHNHLKSQNESCDIADIQEAISKCLEGVTVESVEAVSQTLTRLDLRIEQPVNHFDTNSERFSQRLVLFHNSNAKPMVLATTGYGLYATNRHEPTQLANANQLLVEHRYFEPSAPTNLVWEHLNVLQSAHDFHRVTEQFKKIYKAAWVNTGGSKGGMTSVYHRRFFPSDLDGTVAYVAPHSLSDADTRYNTFLSEVGGSNFATCRADLLAFRQEVLKRKTKLASMIGDSGYDRFGGTAGAIEVAAAEFHFVFWQYQSPNQCGSIPASSASDQGILNFFTSVSHFQDSYSDEGIEYFAPYFYQAATELGAPAWDLEGIDDLIENRSNLSFDVLMPEGVTVTYAPDSMQSVGQWVRDESAKIMYIYGEFDPWSAAMFDMGTSVERDSHRFIVSRGNHGSKISQLSGADRKKATQILSSWLGVGITNVSDFVGEQVVEAYKIREGLRP